MNKYTSLWAFSLPMIAFLIALGIGLAFVPDESGNDHSREATEEKASQTEAPQSSPEGQQ